MGGFPPPRPAPFPWPPGYEPAPIAKRVEIPPLDWRIGASNMIGSSLLATFILLCIFDALRMVS